jgi:hypothetical protein
MFRPLHLSPVPRRGVILLVVLALLTLFAVVGLAFVLYAEATADVARVFREAATEGRPDMEPELALALFLNQLIYDATDDEGGIYSALRGHSLARLMYGSLPESTTIPRTANSHPWSGVGRPHTGPAARDEPATYLNPFGIDDYLLPNYTYYPADGFLRDPEHLNPSPRAATPWRTGPGQPRGPNLDCNAPYTYPDLNNLFLAAVRADGTVLLPSYHRPWTGFGSLDPSNPNWTDPNPRYKYMVLRPRPIDQLLPGETWPLSRPAFPPPADAGGDVKNLIGAPGGNDSFWIDINAPVLMTPDGRKYKMLVAPLIVDLDGRVNVNVHGNIRGRVIDPATQMQALDPATGRPRFQHVSNHGLGPWEVNLGWVLTNGDEWTNLFLGSGYRTSPQAPPLLGRYGGAPGEGQLGRPRSAGGAARAVGRPLRFFAQLDVDGSDEGNGFTPTGPVRLASAGADADNPFPLYPPGYGNGSAAELADHPLLYDFFHPQGGNLRFSLSNLEALLRAGDTGSGALTSDLLRLCPENLTRSPEAARRRRLLTTHSSDRVEPGVSPWAYDAATNPPYQMSAGGPLGPPLPFPSLNRRYDLELPSNSDFTVTWQAVEAALGRIDLNRPLPPCPQTAGTGGRFDTFDTRFPTDDPRYDVPGQYLRALKARQDFANDLYRALLRVTRVPTVPLERRANPSADDLRTRRWLAQLAVNLVDFLDDDDLITPFNFYTAEDAGVASFDVGALSDGDRELPRYWVFGTELPRVVLNEVLAEYRDPGPGMQAYPNKVWVELHNPMHTPPAGSALQPQDGVPVPLHVEGLAGASAARLADNNGDYAPYRVILADQVLIRPGIENDNVLGKPATVRTQTQDADFRQRADLVGAGQQATPFPTIAPQGFLLLGPTGTDLHNSIAAPDVPVETPLVHTDNLQYRVTIAGTQRTPDDRQAGVTVLLRRLANPHLPFDDVRSLTVSAGMGRVTHPPNPWYNPYVTVDYLERVPLHNATDPAATYASRGKRQPYAARFKPASTAPTAAAADSPVVDQQSASAGTTPRTVHTFGRRNNPLPLSRHYDWLVHLDRQVISPMEVLHVSAFPPYQLTQNFIIGDDTQPGQKFQHYVPWLAENRRLYRLFEFLTAHPRAAGVPQGGRIPGKINLNTIWDPETFLALCDPQPANAFHTEDVYLPLRQPTDPPDDPTKDDPANPRSIYWRMLRTRTPGLLSGGGPGSDDRPFRGLATGYSTGDAQSPRGTGINDTLLRAGAGDGLLFQIPAGSVPNGHPYFRNELLTKIFNQVTVRSNVFAVWVTVGFFEVIDNTSRPVKLGAEIGRAENRHVRHRMFAIVDRSDLRVFATRSTTAVAAPGLAVVTPTAMSGTANGVPWAIRGGNSGRDGRHGDDVHRHVRQSAPGGFSDHRSRESRAAAVVRPARQPSRGAVLQRDRLMG